MNRIDDIYKITRGHQAEFRGTLRNERRFEYGQQVFIGSGHGESIMVFPAIVKGITDDGNISNPSYIYKVQIPDWAVKKEQSIYDEVYSKSQFKISWYKFRLRYRSWRLNVGLLKDTGSSYSNLSCDRIFTSVKQAKESVMKNHEVMTKLERENIDRYFTRFDDINK